MNGAHDLGGKTGMGVINPEDEKSEPVFHSEWERRVFALTIATGMLGKWNIDESRHARERQAPETYLKNSYYENWLEGVEKLLLEKELLEPDELENSAVETTEVQPEKIRVPDSEAATKILFSGGPSTMETDSAPLFKVGDRVFVEKNQSQGHTRVPAYVQGSTGSVVDHYGCHVFPDRNAHGEHRGEHLYSVLFSGTELWGEKSENAEVVIDLWQPYLTLADAKHE